MFCRECGAGLSADSKFCKDCGAKIGASVKTMSLTVQDLEPVTGDANQERLTKLLDMAFWHNDAGNVDAAIKACEAALSINPASTTAHSLLATLFEKKGDDERAIAHLEAVLQINPDSIADQTKLEQLQRGIHVKAIQPPAGYRWIPPALAGVAGTGLKLKLDNLLDRKVGNVRVMPLVYSGLATALVLGIGLAAVRTQEKSVAATPSPSITSTTTVASLPPQPMSTAPVGSSSALSNPFSTAPSTPTAKPSQNDLAKTPDVFSSGADDPVARQIFSAAEDRVGGGSSSSTRLHADDGGTNAKPLPALKAVPMNTGSLAPAPVEIAPGSVAPTATQDNTTPLVTTGSLPRHTVVVSQLDQNQSNTGQNDGSGSSQQSQAQSPDQNSGLVPVVRVTVHDAPSSGNTEINRGSAPVSVPAVHNEEAPAYQQYALSLQQKGDYKGAAAAYERAIRTYKARIREGHDSDDVQRGLRACQTGLEICQQSL